MRIDKTNGRSAASRKHLPYKEPPSTERGPIEAEIGSIIKGEHKSQSTSIYSLSPSLTYTHCQDAKQKSRTATGRTE